MELIWLTSLSALIVMMAAALLPAGRIRSVFVFMGLLMFLLLILSFRLTRPERFVRPESFASLMLYLKSLESPDSPWLPSTWFFDSLKASLSGSMKSAFFHSALSWSFAITTIFVTTWVSGAIYFRGLSKAQTASSRFFSSLGFRSPRYGFFLKFLSGPARAFAVKEIKTFFRDQTQWSQIFLVAALIVIYLYNFSVLPLDKSAIKMEYLQNLISFLNMGLAAFVLSAVSARFVFPAVSLEGDAFWIVKSSPVSIRTFLWIKFFVYFFPLLILSEILIIATNILLRCNPFHHDYFHPDHLFYGSRHHRHGNRAGRHLSGFSLGEPGSVCDEFWWSDLDDSMYRLYRVGHRTGGWTYLQCLYDRYSGG